jgi:hypothetical protein
MHRASTDIEVFGNFGVGFLGILSEEGQNLEVKLINFEVYRHNSRK